MRMCAPFSVFLHWVIAFVNSYRGGSEEKEGRYASLWTGGECGKPAALPCQTLRVLLVKMVSMLFCICRCCFSCCSIGIMYFSLLLIISCVLSGTFTLLWIGFTLMMINEVLSILFFIADQTCNTTVTPVIFPVIGQSVLSAANQNAWVMTQ